MSDLTEAPAAAEVTPPVGNLTEDAPAVSSETPAEPATVPKDRFDKVVAAEKNLRSRLKELEDASKSEADLLRERAMEAARLAPEVERLQAENAAYVTALSAEIAAQKEALPKELSSLLPSKSSPVEQLDWLRKARKTAETLTSSRAGLPPSGGRSPSTGSQTETVEQIAQRKLATGDYPRL